MDQRRIYKTERRKIKGEVTEKDGPKQERKISFPHQRNQTQNQGLQRQMDDKRQRTVY